MIRRLLLAFALVLSSALAPLEANAQFGSGSSPVGHLAPEDAARFSKQIEQDLAARGARIAIVFRSGRAKKDMPEGLAYTHGAFWIYQPAVAEDGREMMGYAVYNLYQGDGETLPRTRSYLAQDFPFDFVSGSATDDVAVIIPTPEMQRRIIEVVASDTYRRLHNPSYTLIANPLRNKHQNCNGFMLDVIAAAAWQTDDPKQIRANIAAHFKPSVIKTNALTRLFAPMVDERLKTDDQSGPIRTAAYESLAAFMAENGLMDATYTLERFPKSMQQISE